MLTQEYYEKKLNDTNINYEEAKEIYQKILEAANLVFDGIQDCYKEDFFSCTDQEILDLHKQHIKE